MKTGVKDCFCPSAEGLSMSRCDMLGNGELLIIFEYLHHIKKCDSLRLFVFLFSLPAKMDAWKILLVQHLLEEIPSTLHTSFKKYSIFNTSFTKHSLCVQPLLSGEVGRLFICVGYK